MWKERGTGDIRFLQHKDTKKAAATSLRSPPPLAFQCSPPASPPAQPLPDPPSPHHPSHIRFAPFSPPTSLVSECMHIRLPPLLYYTRSVFSILRHPTHSTL
eukprot:4726212-Pleurochrysis_carterae.AAC.4